MLDCLVGSGGYLRGLVLDLKTDYIGKPIEGSRNIRLIIILHITKPSLIIHMKCYSKYYIALI